MKAAAFELVVPPDLAAATAALRDGQARALSGGQSLGPMLNFRAARPSCLVQLTRLADLSGVEEDATAITIGAAVTHAAIEDGRVPDIGHGILARVAGGIAYRAVRNRGTIGGSLCHADPAADWVTVLTALGAVVLLASAAGARSLAMADFMRGAYRTALRSGEMLHAVRIPRLAQGSGWGYAKACRKPGEFAHAMAAVLRKPDGRHRVVVGAQGGVPMLVENANAIEDVIVVGDAVERHLASVNLRRAWEQAQK